MELDSQRRVLITGGFGLVGRALAWAIDHDASDTPGRESWRFSSRRDGDLRRYEEAEALFQLHLPHIVIHLAAKVGGVYANSTHQADFLSDNVRIDQNVLALCHKYKVAKVISCLSTCVFPHTTSLPLTEQMLHDGPPHDSNFGYAYAKRLLDISNRAYNAQYGSVFTAIVPTNIYGPDDNFGLGCHFIPAMIKKVWHAKAQGTNQIEVAGSGQALRQFMFSRDVARVLLWMMRNYSEVEPVIVSVSEEEEITIRDTVQRICRLAGFEGEVKWNTSLIDGQMRKTTDTSKLRSLIPSFRTTPLDDGLGLTLQWYAERYELLQGRL